MPTTCSPQWVAVIFRLDEGERNVRLVVEDISLPAGEELPSDNDAPFGEVNLITDL